jgi:SAM-dependent methyltransferase
LAGGELDMTKLSVEQVVAYWNQRIGESEGSWEGVLWPELPRWNKYVDGLQMHHLKKYFKQVKACDTLLDLGCGIGRFTFRLAGLCKEIYGVDGSEEAIKICHKKIEHDQLSNVRFSVMDVRNLKFEDETFDLVLSVTCLQCITDEAGLIKAVREALRVTKTGGKLLWLECTSDKRNDQYNISLPRDRWFKIIEEAGGRLEQWHGIDVPILRKEFFQALAIANKSKQLRRIKPWIEIGLLVS